MKTNTKIVYGIILILMGCNTNSLSTDKNELISSVIKSEIKEKNDAFFECIIKKDANSFQKISSLDLLKSFNGQTSKVLTQAYDFLLMNNGIKNYTVYDEYHVKNIDSNAPQITLNNFLHDEAYKFSFNATNKEAYVCFLLMNVNQIEKALITCIYGKYNDDWKLDVIDFGPFTTSGFTAIELFGKAQVEYENGYLIDAANTLMLMSKCIKPSADFQYKKENEMKSFLDEVKEELNTKYSFPYMVENIDTKPRIFRIQPQVTQEGFFLKVIYASSINIADTLQLKEENEELHSMIGEIYNGIDKDKEVLIYEVFSNKKNQVYRFVQNINKK